jgi:hypothetical protein
VLVVPACYTFQGIHAEVSNVTSDFWLSAVWTVLVTLALVLMDRVGATLIAQRRTLGAIERTIDRATTLRAQREALSDHLERLRLQAEASGTWGVDLSMSALSVDFAAFALWNSDPRPFRFFARFDSVGTSRGSEIWLILILIHFLLFMASIALRHLHEAQVERSDVAWVSRNRWKLIGNAIGILALFSTFVVLTNAI